MLDPMTRPTGARKYRWRPPEGVDSSTTTRVWNTDIPVDRCPQWDTFNERVISSERHGCALMDYFPDVTFEERRGTIRAS